MKKLFVVCINGLWTPARIGMMADAVKPKEGEIYEVEEIIENPLFDGKDYYVLVGFNRGYETSHFRPVDDTYGEIVVENLEKQIEYEEAIS